MKRQYTIAEARDKFAALVHRAEEEEPIEVTRRGKPVAIILSIEAYRRLQNGQTSFWQALDAFREGFDLEGLDIDPEIFSEIRDRSPGREVIL